MKLQQSTWPEVEAYLKSSQGIIIPTGSTEQHGPIGLIGTDALCAEEVAVGAGEIVSGLVAPTLALTPAPFNTGFPGTLSISARLFGQLIAEIIHTLSGQGFRYFYFLNGHGANLEPLQNCITHHPNVDIRVRSWWDFPEVNRLRQDFYGDWEGMHATPSEIAITQVNQRVIATELARQPPEKLSAAYIKQHAGDKHGPPDQHRRQFPDGRVGSHSALAKKEHGKALLQAAIAAVAKDYQKFTIKS